MQKRNAQHILLLRYSRRAKEMINGSKNFIMIAQNSKMPGFKWPQKCILQICKA